jgi:hypothetical protein
MSAFRFKATTSQNGMAGLIPASLACFADRLHGWPHRAGHDRCQCEIPRANCKAGVLEDGGGTPPPSFLQTNAWRGTGVISTKQNEQFRCASPGRRGDPSHFPEVRMGTFMSVNGRWGEGACDRGFNDQDVAAASQTPSTGAFIDRAGRDRHVPGHSQFLRPHARLSGF